MGLDIAILGVGAAAPGPRTRSGVSSLHNHSAHELNLNPNVPIRSCAVDDRTSRETCTGRAHQKMLTGA